MTTAVQKFDSDTPNWKKRHRQDSSFLPDISSTAATGFVIIQPEDYPSLSIEPASIYIGERTSHHRRFAPHLSILGRTPTIHVSLSLEAADVSSSSTFLQEAEPDQNVWRGVFSPQPRRKVLFSKKIDVRLGDLPRWKPYITIDRRTLEKEEEHE
jgi:hypothetical protein